MALWGKSDKIYSVGTIEAIDYDTKIIIGSGTSFTAAKVGDVITLGTNASYGEAVINEITSNTTISVASTEFLLGEGGELGISYSISEKPVYTLEDSNYSATQIYGVDINETGAVADTQYAVAHAGWVGVHTYIDMHNNLRVKSEVLVAMSEITGGEAPTYSTPGDAADDSIYPDAIISILSNPVSVGVGTTQTATFSVEVSVTPDYAPLTYEWYEYDGVTPAYIVGTNSNTLSVVNTDASKNGYEYYATVYSGDVSATSGIATMTVS